MSNNVPTSACPISTKIPFSPTRFLPRSYLNSKVGTRWEHFENTHLSNPVPTSFSIDKGKRKECGIISKGFGGLQVGTWEHRSPS